MVCPDFKLGPVPPGITDETVYWAAAGRMNEYINMTLGADHYLAFQRLIVRVSRLRNDRDVTYSLHEKQTIINLMWARYMAHLNKLVNKSTV